MPLTPFSPHFEDAAHTFEVTPPVSSAVGIQHFHAVDESRGDISTGKRQFMVSAFYPAQADGDAPRARLTDILLSDTAAALELLACEGGLSQDEKDSTFERLKSLTLRAQRSLKPSAAAPCPVLIYYPGGVSHRLSNAALCERFASEGYVVFALDAPRDAPVVAFPDGQLVPFLSNNEEDYIWPRVADVHFLLDQLEMLNVDGEFEGLLDLKRIGMFGHSRGGYLSNICAVEDARIKAAANMDGFLWGLWTEGTGLSEYPKEFQNRARNTETPVLRLRGAQGSKEAARQGYEEEARDFGGHFVSVAIRGYEHGSFSTTPWMCGQAKDLGKNAMQPPVPPERVDLLMELLSDFFETYLLGRRRRMKLVGHPAAGMDVFFLEQS